MSLKIVKKIQPNLGFINKEYGFKICEFAFFYYSFLKNLEISFPQRKL